MRRTCGPNCKRGFTLIEILVSITILVILMAIIFQIINLTTSAYKQSTQGTGTMQQARVAFERMTRTLSQATLNTYYNYSSGAVAVSSHYVRQSELQFISGYGPIGTNGTFITTAGQNAVQVTHAVFFQAPLGVVTSADASNYGNLGNLLNACGYFVTYGPDTSRPAFLGTGTGTSTSVMSNAPVSENRFRLMEYLQPSENLSVYTVGAVPATGLMPSWITNGLPTDLTASPPVNVHALASNIVALIIMPEQFTSGTAANGEANTTYVSSPVSGDAGGTGDGNANSYQYDSAYGSNPPANGAQATYTGTSSILQWQTGNQLPPLVKVVMVAIDETSGTRLAAKYPNASSISPPDLGNLFTSSPALFQKPGQLFTTGGVEGDLEKLEDTLNSLKLNYYVFQSDVIIRGAKWTAN